VTDAVRLLFVYTEKSCSWNIVVKQENPGHDRHGILRMIFAGYEAFLNIRELLEALRIYK
jgi:hypothetical protein